MSAPKRGDAAFIWTESGQEAIHHLGAALRQPRMTVRQIVDRFDSADLTTVRAVSVGSGVEDLTAVIRYDGNPYQLAQFIAAGRRGASIEYLPSLSNPSESYPCVLVNAPEIGNDRDFWHERRHAVEVVLRRIDGGTWQGVLEGTLFYWLAGNTASGLTFTRSGTIGPYVDEDGVIQDDVTANLWRTDWWDVDGDLAVETPTLLLEPARTNVNDEDDLTLWSTSGTPVVTGSVDGPAGGTGAYTVEDDDGAVQEYVERTLTFTGDAVKSMVFVIRENTMASSGNQLLVLRDTSAAADRLLFAITGWTNGQPSITDTTGTLLGSRYIGNGYWAIYAQTTSVTAANTNVVRIYPANTSAATGSIDVYRVNAFDATIPSHSILGESAARNAETWYADFLPTPQRIAALGGMTVYVKCLPLGTLAITNARLFEIGSAAAGDPRFFVSNSGGNFSVGHDIGATSSSATLSAAPSYGELTEIRAVLNDDGSVLIGQSIDGATETTASDATTQTVQEAWADTRLYLNSAGTVVRGCAAFIEVKVATGVKTMAEMRLL